MPATTTTHYSSHTPTGPSNTHLDTMPNSLEESVRALVESYAPAELLDDTEACEYLCSLLASGDQEPDELVDLVGQFFGEETVAAQALVDRVAELTLENNNEEPLETLETLPLSVSPSKSVVDQNREENATESTSEDSTQQQSEKSRERRRKQEERKTERQKRKPKQTDDFVDDDVSAWAERKSEGKTWGGRGYGGRGVRGDVNTASNIHLSNVTLSFAGNELLQNTTIQINGGHRYGLIGRNGCGKSTLLRRLATKSIPGMPQDLRILLVQQQVDGGQESALQVLLNSDVERRSLLDEQAHLEEKIDESISDASADLEQIVERLGEVAALLDAMDADQAEERAKELLRGLQFTKEMMEGPTENLSGGWRMRLALAQALFVYSDLLLLDEPTNHLDLHALLWLTNYLANSNKTMIVVSHDRAFLDMCTDIISMEHKKLVYHVGNYSAYEQQQEEKASRQAQILDASERQRAKAVTFIQKQQAGSKKSQDPKKQRQAKMIKEKKLERIGNYREDGKRYKNRSLKTLSEDSVRVAQKVVIEADQPVVKMKFPDPTWAPGMTPGCALVKFEDVTFGYTTGNTPLLNDLTLQLNRESKLAIVGRNGTGKSTILKLITGELLPSKDANEFKGTLWRNPSLRIGHVTQHSVEALNEYGEMSVVEYAEKYIRSGKACSSVVQSASGNIRQYLGAFGLGGTHAHRPIASLSGGERMRLCFAQVLSESPQLLCLDEPSNHLDMETLDSLSAALNAFQGAVVVVSHNQGKSSKLTQNAKVSSFAYTYSHNVVFVIPCPAAFLSGFCKDLWVVENGSVDVRHSDTESFDDMFSQYRHEAMMGATSRSSKRQQKATMAKKAQHQRSGAKQNIGFIP